MINFTIKMLDATDHSFSVEDWVTVLQLKEKVAQQIGIHSSMQRLIFCGKVLQDTRRLSSYRVNGKVVHLVERAPPFPLPHNTNRPPTQPLGPWMSNENPEPTPRHLTPPLFDDQQIQMAPTNARMEFIRRMLDEIRAQLADIHELTRNETELPAGRPPSPSPSEPEPESTESEPMEVDVISRADNDMLPMEENFREEETTRGRAILATAYQDPLDLADVFDEVDTMFDDIGSLRATYSHILRINYDDPENPIDVDTRRRYREIFEKISELMHNFSHAYHVITDFSLDFSNEPNSHPSISSEGATMRPVPMNLAGRLTTPASERNITRGVDPPAPITYHLEVETGMPFAAAVERSALNEMQQQYSAQYREHEEDEENERFAQDEQSRSGHNNQNDDNDSEEESVPYVSFATPAAPEENPQVSGAFQSFMHSVIRHATENGLQPTLSPERMAQIQDSAGITVNRAIIQSQLSRAGVGTREVSFLTTNNRRPEENDQSVTIENAAHMPIDTGRGRPAVNNFNNYDALSASAAHSANVNGSQMNTNNHETNGTGNAQDGSTNNVEDDNARTVSTNNARNGLLNNANTQSGCASNTESVATSNTAIVSSTETSSAINAQEPSGSANTNTNSRQSGANNTGTDSSDYGRNRMCFTGALQTPESSDIRPNNTTVNHGDINNPVDNQRNITQFGIVSQNNSLPIRLTVSNPGSAQLYNPNMNNFGAQIQIIRNELIRPGGLNAVTFLTNPRINEGANNENDGAQRLFQLRQFMEGMNARLLRSAAVTSTVTSGSYVEPARTVTRTPTATVTSTEVITIDSSSDSEGLPDLATQARTFLRNFFEIASTASYPVTAPALGPDMAQVPTPVRPPATVSAPATERIPVGSISSPATERIPAGTVSAPATERIPATIISAPATERIPAVKVSAPATERIPAAVSTPATERIPAAVSAPATERIPAGTVLAPATERIPAATVAAPATERVPATERAPATASGSAIVHSPATASASGPGPDTAMAQDPDSSSNTNNGTRRMRLTDIDPDQDIGGPGIYRIGPLNTVTRVGDLDSLPHGSTVHIVCRQVMPEVPREGIDRTSEYAYSYSNTRRGTRRTRIAPNAGAREETARDVGNARRRMLAFVRQNDNVNLIPWSNLIYDRFLSCDNRHARNYLERRNFRSLNTYQNNNVPTMPPQPLRASAVINNISRYLVYQNQDGLTFLNHLFMAMSHEIFEDDMIQIVDFRVSNLYSTRSLLRNGMCYALRPINLHSSDNFDIAAARIARDFSHFIQHLTMRQPSVLRDDINIELTITALFVARIPPIISLLMNDNFMYNFPRRFFTVCNKLYSELCALLRYLAHNDIECMRTIITNYIMLEHECSNIPVWQRLLLEFMIKYLHVNRGEYRANITSIRVFFSPNAGRVLEDSDDMDDEYQEEVDDENASTCTTASIADDNTASPVAGPSHGESSSSQQPGTSKRAKPSPKKLRSTGSMTDLVHGADMLPYGNYSDYYYDLPREFRPPQTRRLPQSVQSQAQSPSPYISIRAVHSGPSPSHLYQITQAQEGSLPSASFAETATTGIPHDIENKPHDEINEDETIESQSLNDGTADDQPNKDGDNDHSKEDGEAAANICEVADSAEDKAKNDEKNGKVDKTEDKDEGAGGSASGEGTSSDTPVDARAIFNERDYEILQHDLRAQRNRGPTEPFSDAYMSGMPVNKRRRIRQTSANLVNMDTFINDTLQSVSGNDQPVAEADIDQFRTAFKQQVGTMTRDRSNVSEDYDPTLFPEAENLTELLEAENLTELKPDDEEEGVEEEGEGENKHD